MAYDLMVAQRIRDLLSQQPNILEKKMFGGIGFLANGNMACGVIGDELIVRVGPEGYETSLAMPHTRPFDFSGKPMHGWVYVNPAGFTADIDLDAWVQRGVNFAGSLPPK